MGKISALASPMQADTRQFQLDLKKAAEVTKRFATVFKTSPDVGWFDFRPPMRYAPLHQIPPIEGITDE